MTNHLTFTITILIISFTSTFQIAKAFTKFSDRFPFYKNTLRLETDPGFELRRAEKPGSAAIIRFPSYDGNLIVKSVSYEARKIELIDPEKCVHGVFLDLDLSLTPFRYYHRLKSYTYLNCSAELASLVEIPCLSVHGRHVYTVKPQTEVPVYCEVIKTVGIPFGYSPYLDDDSFGLGLTWDDKSSVYGQAFIAAGLLQGYMRAGLGVGIIILAVAATLLTIKTNNNANKSIHGDELNNSQVQAYRYFGDYKSCSTDEADNADQVNGIC